MSFYLIITLGIFICFFKILRNIIYNDDDANDDDDGYDVICQA